MNNENLIESDFSQDYFTVFQVDHCLMIKSTRERERDNVERGENRLFWLNNIIKRSGKGERESERKYLI